MQFDGALVREQGITFAVVSVKRHVLDNNKEAQSAILSFSRVFPGVPVVLMGENSFGEQVFYGRRDISAFLSKVGSHRLPWKRYTLN